MRKSYLAATALAGTMAVAGVAKADNTGCGLGSMVWEGQSGIAQDILAVTTNGISANQFFGITSGTLGCEHGATITAEADAFMAENMESIIVEAANGGGESIDTLAALLDIEEADRGEFAEHMQQNFAEIFPSENVTAGEVMENLESSMAASETLNRYTA
ncbi:hypothetical protein HH1059_20850 [Halorhodospira halochloris]|uniref:DUF3015 domain-containing protein n=1 Tax=Halorhodospira halochloris TaxID=1052 RepID=A0A0X8XCZ0_HALHR|nr:DUF3015 family protein [Halorhodospira halochloris]MBK1651870.1 hypothetical protein [Halorhodospira halochloris]BAU58794.1 hypothetical protein HH1059_20850 [Halorhodospira halochloris]